MKRAGAQDSVRWVGSLVRPLPLLFAVLSPSSCRSGEHAQDDVNPRVAGHLSELLEVARENSVNRFEVDWVKLKSVVMNEATGAQTIREAEPAIRRMLEALEDGHSFYQSSTEKSPLDFSEALNRELRAFRVSVAEPCIRTNPATPRIPNHIGYVRIPGSANSLEEDLRSIEQQVAVANRPGLSGLLVDLRGNHGGNMWPMLQAVGPILGEGIAGYFIEPDGTSLEWGYEAGRAVVDGEPALQVESATAPLRPAPRVAVLIDEATVSSGEAIAVAFRGRPDTRSFGTPTCGRSSANRPFRLQNGAVLFLTVAILADRNGVRYEGRLEPDESAKAEQAVLQAIKWITEAGP